jgi:hypothetical protein
LKLREAELVNDELLATPLNINLRYGGEGGGGGFLVTSMLINFTKPDMRR